MVIQQIHNSGTLAKITLSRISSREGELVKRVNGNRRRGYAVKACSWDQTLDVAVVCLLPTRSTDALAFDKGATTAPCRQSEVPEWVPLSCTDIL